MQELPSAGDFKRSKSGHLMKHMYHNVQLGSVVQSMVSLTSSLRGQLFKCCTAL